LWLSSLRGWWREAATAAWIRTYALVAWRCDCRAQLLAASGVVDSAGSISWQPRFGARDAAGGVLFGLRHGARTVGSRALVLLGRGNLR